MIRTIAVILVLATPAMATQDGWPALYDVSGVAADDVLNLRAGPSVSEDIIGTLSADTTDVEVVRPNDAGTWGLVNSGEGSGWVSLAFMARQGGQWHGQMPNVTQCFGTEPFWSLKQDGATIALSTPSEATRSGLISGRFRSQTRVDRFAFQGSFFPSDAGERDVLLSLRTEACSDGMSDRAYGISVDMFLSGSDDPEANGLYSGCCTIAPLAK